MQGLQPTLHYHMPHLEWNNIQRVKEKVEQTNCQGDWMKAIFLSNLNIFLQTIHDREQVSESTTYFEAFMSNAIMNLR